MSHLITPAYSPLEKHFPAELGSSFTTTLVSTPVDSKDRWAHVYEQARRSVVRIRTTVHTSFDTETMSSSTATGFVVDSDLGIILSNRHVMTTAPATHYARFENTESVRLMPWYYDPVLDFAFFKYNPADLTIASPKAVNLAPEKACEGLEIRVVSCDSGEYNSVASGIIANTKRPAKSNHVCFNYHEFNTFYYVAAAGTRGGSSGAPVLDSDGDAVALNVGGINQTQQSLFLPLHRVAKTLAHLRLGILPLRGTIQTMFHFDLNEALSQADVPLKAIYSMHPQLLGTSGMLKVHRMVPGSAVSKILQVDDVVFAADGRYVADFEALFEILDEFIGNTVVLSVCRSSTLLSLKVPVQDLFSQTPTKLLRIGTGGSEIMTNFIVCDVSFTTAISILVPMAGVAVADTNPLFSSAGVHRGCIVTKLNGQNVRSLGDFIAKLQSSDTTKGLMLHVKSEPDWSVEKVCLVPVIPAVYKYEVMERQSNSGYWSTSQIYRKLLSPTKKVLQLVTPLVLQGSALRYQKMHSSIVDICYYGLATTDGRAAVSVKGQGYVASKTHGIVVCRSTAVPTFVGAVSIIIATTVEVPAHVVYIDPMSCFTYLKYDPADVFPGALEEAPIDASLDKLSVGENVTCILTNYGDQPILHQTQIKLRNLVPFDNLDPGHEQVLNIEGLMLGSSPSSSTAAFICDDQGNLRAAMISRSYSGSQSLGEYIQFAVDINQTLPVVECLKRGQQVLPRSLNVEFSFISLLNAQLYGLSSQRVEQFCSEIEFKRSLYKVVKAPNSGLDSQDLLENDILLKVNGKWVVDVSLLSVFYKDVPMEFLVCRDGKEILLRPKLQPMRVNHIKRIVNWCGMSLEPYSGLNSKQRNWPESGVCITVAGSNLADYHMVLPQLLTHVDGMPIKNMDDLSVAIKKTKIENEGFINRLKNNTVGILDRVPSTIIKIRLLNKAGISHEAVIESDVLYSSASCVESP
ncbi:hypothetical protein GGI07_001546 [Coemansia sp. Benny D115]|nr:hypothetical protein GGI07_001546 [Coemansia sp. Benny D115]